VRGNLGRQTNIWLLDLLGRGNTQLTFGSGGHVTPIWSPDGAWIAFSKPPNQLRQKAASGAGDEELLVKENDTNYLRPTDWSHDGRYLIYTNVDPKTRADIWALSNPRGDPSSRRSIPVLKTANVEHFGVLSPDARWMAYLGEDESGREEVYVTSFDVPSGGTSGAGGHWRISQDGAVLVRWRRDGKELFYKRPDGDLIAVEVTTQSVFRQGAHRTLFRAASNAWDVASDGSRFLFSMPPPNENYAPITAVMNWTAALKR
jgi:Tol biopolymer transport system component